MSFCYGNLIMAWVWWYMYIISKNIKFYFCLLDWRQCFYQSDHVWVLKSHELRGRTRLPDFFLQLISEEPHTEYLWMLEHHWLPLLGEIRWMMKVFGGSFCDLHNKLENIENSRKKTEWSLFRVWFCVQCGFYNPH